jgi:hypothetical protein
MGACDRRANRVPDLGIVLAPDIARWRIATSCSCGFEDRIRRLNALGFLKLTQIIPGRQENDPFRVDDHDSVDVSVVAQEDCAFRFCQWKVAYDFDGCPFARISLDSAALSGQTLKLVLERLGRFDLYGRVARPLPIDDCLSAELVDLTCRLVKHSVWNDDGKVRVKQIIERLRCPASVMSGGASATMRATSTAMSLEARLQQRSGALHICPAFRRVGRLRQVEAVLGQRNQEVCEVLKSGARDRLPGAERPVRVGPQRLKVFRISHVETQVESPSSPRDVENED